MKPLKFKQNLERNNDNVVASLTWFKNLMELDAAARKRQVAELLKGVKTIGSLEDKPTKKGMELYKMLTDEREVTLIGFSPSILYGKAKGSHSDLNYGWLHPFSMPTLLFHHKKTGVLMLVNPWLDFDDVSIADIPLNRNKISKMVNGITG